MLLSGGCLQKHKVGPHPKEKSDFLSLCYDVGSGELLASSSGHDGSLKPHNPFLMSFIVRFL